MSFLNLTIQLINDLNEKYEVSYKDLETTIGEIENSLKNIVPGIKFKLKETSDGPGGTIFSLDLDPNSNDMGIDLVKITDFFIPAQGYPIEHGRFSKQLSDFTTSGEIQNKEQLVDFFKNLLSTSDSRLVQSIGYAARRHKLGKQEDSPF